MFLFGFLKSTVFLFNYWYIQVQEGHSQSDGEMMDFCDSVQFKEHPLFSQDPHALQIILYYDDVEFCNPLGAYRKKHKLGKHNS